MTAAGKKWGHCADLWLPDAHVVSTFRMAANPPVRRLM
jgi:hypothetical protein